MPAMSVAPATGRLMRQRRRSAVRCGTGLTACAKQLSSSPPPASSLPPQPSSPPRQASVPAASLPAPTQAVGNSFVAPRILRQAVPAIPPGVASGILAEVQMDVMVAIDAGGKVVNARVVTSRGGAAGPLTIPALKAAELCRFAASSFFSFCATAARRAPRSAVLISPCATAGEK